MCFPVKAESGADELRAQLEEIQGLRAALAKQEKEIYEKLEDLELGRDTTRGVSNICPVHKVEMQIKLVPIKYGLLLHRRDDPTPEIRTSMFPFNLEFCEGGCITSNTSPKEARVYHCAECARAEKKWIKEHTPSEQK